MPMVDTRGRIWTEVSVLEDGILVETYHSPAYGGSEQVLEKHWYTWLDIRDRRRDAEVAVGDDG